MTEEKEKVVGSVWEAEFMKFLHTHRRRIKKEEKERSSRLFGGKNLFNSMPG